MVLLIEFRLGLQGCIATKVGHERRLAFWAGCFALCVSQGKCRSGSANVCVCVSSESQKVHALLVHGRQLFFSERTLKTVLLMKSPWVSDGFLPRNPQRRYFLLAFGWSVFDVGNGISVAASLLVSYS